MTSPVPCSTPLAMLPICGHVVLFGRFAVVDILVDVQAIVSIDDHGLRLDANFLPVDRYGYEIDLAERSGSFSTRKSTWNSQEYTI